MTACNIWTSPTAGHLVTDAAFYDESGSMVAIASKVVICHSIKMAITALGCFNPMRIAAVMREIGPATLSEAIVALPHVGAMLKAENQAAGVEAPDLVLCAMAWWPDENRPAAVAVSTGGRQPLFGPGVVREIDSYFTPPAEVPGLPDVQSLDPVRDGLAILEAQRATPDTDGAVIVGGYGELTTVTADGVTQRRLVDWADAIGRRIAARDVADLPAISDRAPLRPCLRA